MCGCVDVRMYGCMDVGICMDAWMHGCMDAWMVCHTSWTCGRSSLRDLADDRLVCPASSGLSNNNNNNNNKDSSYYYYYGFPFIIMVALL